MKKKEKRTYRHRKITWRMVYEEFKQRHPNLGKRASCFRPHSYATILIFLKDGTKMLYNYDNKMATFIREEED